jgi:signal transduction histidine kinase
LALATIVGIAVVIGTFVASTWIVRWRLGAIAQVMSVAHNGAPSVRFLAQAREDLFVIRNAAVRRAVELHLPDDRAAGPKDSLEDMRRARLSLGESIAAEMKTPMYSGEAASNRQVEAALRKLDTAFAALQGPDHDAATTGERLRTLRQAADDLDLRLDELHDINALGLQADANALLAKQESSLALISWLDVAGIIVAGLVTLVLAKILKRHVRLENERRRVVEERASELEAFSARVAHDLRSPLSRVSLALAVADAAPDPATAASSRERALASVRSMGKIVEDLLLFARSGGRPVAGAHTSVPGVLQAVLDEVRPLAAREHIEIDAGEIPACEVACESGILTVVLTNLINNGIKFMGDKRERRIGVEVRVATTMVRFEVRDTGMGLPPGFERFAFNPYVRAQTKTQGLGLGLATVKRFVTAYGGRVGAMSRAGEGSLFWFELPRLQLWLAASAPLLQPA